MPFIITKSVLDMVQKSPEMKEAVDAILAKDAAFNWFSVWEDDPSAERFPESFETPEGRLYLSWNYSWEYGYMGIGSYLMSESEHQDLDHMLHQIDNELGLGHFNEIEDLGMHDPFNDFDLGYQPTLCENIDIYYEQAVAAVEDMFRTKYVDE